MASGLSCDRVWTSPGLRVCHGSACLQDGSRVEGSANFGGLQPSYRIDLQSEPVRQFLVKVPALKAQSTDFWEQVFILSQYARQQTIHWEYTNPVYLELIQKYRQQQQDIPLSEYLVHRCGVCREQAMLLHLALRKAGFETRYQYVHVFRFGKHTEDHAFATVRFQGEDWIVDSRNSGFSGRRLADAIKKGGIQPEDPVIPMPLPPPTFDPFNEEFRFSSYPKIEIPTAGEEP